jgi:apolipoprotein N-acyltransferase
MRISLRLRFWIETVMAIVTGILFGITLIQKNWIELAFGVDPDNNNGALEWLIVGALLVMTITLIILASYEWRRARAAIS